MARGEVHKEVIRLYLETAGDEEIAGLVKQLDKLSQGSDTAADQAAALVGELEKLASTSNNIKQFTLLKASITETGTALDKAKARLAELGAEVDRTDKPTARLQASLKRAAAEVENLSKQQNRQHATLQRTAGALRAAGVDTDQLADAYEKLQDEFGGFSQRAGDAAGAMQKTAREGRAAAGGVSALDKAAKSGKKSVAEIAAQLTLVSGAATAAIKGLMALSGAALFKGGIASATKLEDALSEVRAVAGATADEMVSLKEAAEAGGAATRFSTLEAAQGLGELARATGNAKSAIAALPATLNLAQAAGLGVAESAQFITTTLTQYGLSAEHAARVSDVLAAAANTTTADVQGLGNALSYAAPLANLLGLDVERTAAIIGTLADQGFRGERAGTALRNVFSEMLDPASAFAKALRDLGIESTDFVDVIEQLSTKGKRGQDALLKLDAAARPAILALVNSGGAALRQLDGDLRNTAGSAEETARIMGDNLSGAAEQIKDTFDRTRRSLVEPLLEPLKEELLFLAVQLEEFAGSPEFEEIKVALAGMFAEGAAAARDLVENIDFAELAAKIRLALGDAGETITAFRENIDETTEALTMLADFVSVAFNAAQTAVFLLAAAVAKLSAVGAKLNEAFELPGRKLLHFFGLLEDGVGPLNEIAGGMSAVADEFGDRFVKNLDEAWAAANRLAGTGAEAGEATAAALNSAAAAADAAGNAATRLEEVVVLSSAAFDAQGEAATGSAAAVDAATKRTEANSERLKKAFADMGLVSQEELRQTAESAKANFLLIQQAVQAGEASAEDARRAFAKYAQAARAAVAESDSLAQSRVEAELQVLEAVYQVNTGLDAMAGAGKNAGAGVVSGANAAADALQNLANTGSQVQSKTEKVAEGTKAVGKEAGKTSAEVKKFDIALDGLNDNLVKAYFAANRYVNTIDTGIWSQAINRITAAHDQQAAALARVNAELDAQLSKYDPLAAEMEKLSAQYPYLQEAQLRATAEKSKRLEDEKQRATDEAKRMRAEARAEREAAAKEAQGGPGAPVGGNGPVQGAAGVAGFAKQVVYRIENQAGEGADLYGDAGAEQLLNQVLGGLDRSRAISTRRRR